MSDQGERDGSVLVVDVGTSGVRGAVVRPDASVTAVHYRQVLPSSPAPGLVEFDAMAMADALLDEADPDRRRDLCFGTVDTWIAWHLSGGKLHVTDPSNAAVTGLMCADASAWNPTVLEALRVPEPVLPALVDTSGIVGPASALPGAPPLAALVGDQQASLVGQGCVRSGMAKVTFGTGGMLDVCVGPDRPAFDRQGEQGTFPIVAWRREGKLAWGVEAVMLAAGTNVEWLRDDLGLIATAEESHDLAASCETAGGVMYVPALLGLGTPRWDYGAL